MFEAMTSPPRRCRAAARVAVLLATSFLIIACGSTTKYMAPEAPPPRPPKSAPTEQPETCIAACEQKQGIFGTKKPGGKKAIYDYDCLAKCPDVTVTEGECAEQEKAAGKFCYEKHEKGFVAEVVGGLVALTLTVIVVASAVSK
jgi:hypothetical protein